MSKESEHPALDPQNADLIEGVRALGNRILAAIKLLNPSGYRSFWELNGADTQGDLYESRALATAGPFLLACSIDGWVTATKLPPGPRFNGWMGDGPTEFSLDPDFPEDELRAELQAVLVLEDLSKI